MFGTYRSSSADRRFYMIVVAQLYGVVQLAALVWAARSVHDRRPARRRRHVRPHVLQRFDLDVWAGG